MLAPHRQQQEEELNPNKQQKNKMIYTDKTLKVEELEMKWSWDRSQTLCQNQLKDCLSGMSLIFGKIATKKRSECPLSKK